MLIHIGYAKAASSWTQTMFANDRSGFYSPFDQDKTCVNKHVVYPNPLHFDTDEARSELYSNIEQSRDERTVITSERLAGHWLSGGYDTKEIADRLHAIFPDAKILMIIREQQSMLSSVYRQYVRKGGSRSPEEFFKPRKNIPHGSGGVPPGYSRGPSFSFELFEYDSIIEYYNQLFSSSDVLAIPLEVLKDDTKQFTESIVKFAGANPKGGLEFERDRENVGITPFEAEVQRYLNPIMNRDYINDYSIYHTTLTELMGRGVMKSVKNVTPKSSKTKIGARIEDRIENMVEGRYKKSNHQADTLIDFDLKKYGYDM